MAEYNPSKIIKDGNTYNFRDNTKIPLAGSNAISGDLIPSTDNSIDIGSSTSRIKLVYAHKIVTADDLSLVHTDDGGTVVVSGGTDSTSANLALMGKNYSYLNRNGYFFLQANDGTNSCTLQGTPNGTLTWNGQAIQTTSDQRLKQQISNIDDKLLDAWEDVNLVQFKYNDAVNQKGDNARLHTGFVVQQIDSACKSHGVDVSAYGLYCHEEYPQEVEEVEVEQADGTKTKERKVIREANEHYSLRYTEALIVECKYLRRCVERLTARIEELEKGNITK